MPASDWRRRLAAAGFLAAAGAGPPALGQRHWAPDVSVAVSYHFGGPEGGQWGPTLAVKALREPLDAATAPTWTARPGIGMRLAVLGWRHARLLVTPTLIAADDRSALGAELGLGWQFGARAGGMMQVAALADHSFGHAHLALALGRGASLGAGLRLTRLDLDTTEVQPGRPLRREGRRAPLQPAFRLLSGGPAGAGRDWSLARAAGVWADRARGEWASVPAFHELAAQLQALGAPRCLSSRALAAADDELVHAHLAARTAADLCGDPVALAPPVCHERPPAPGALGLGRLVRESWLDGCIGEGVAAAVARAESARVGPSQLGARLAQVAADEHRHAELAWDVLAWALTRPEARRQLTELAAASPAPITIAGTRDDDLGDLGCLPASRAEALAHAHQQLARTRLRARLAA
jgi:hypothetical protein